MVQIVASYAAGGWIVLEVFDQVVDRGVLPDLAYYLALTWYLAGLAAAVIFGWYHGEKGTQKVTRPEIGLFSAVLLVGIGFSGLVTTRQLAVEPTGVTAGGSGALDPSRIAVLYMADESGGGELGYVADGLTEALIDVLSDVSSLQVVSQNGSLQFKDSDLPRDSLARLLRAGTLVSGSVDDVGDRIRVDVALSDGLSGTEFRRGTFERSAEELFELQTDLAMEVSGFLREWLGEEIDLRRGGQETDNVAAWALMQRGERLRKEGEGALAEGDIDGLVAAFGQADSLLAEAELLDPEWARPVVMRGQITLRFAQLSSREPLEAAEYIDLGMDHVRRALDVDARSAAGLETRGLLSYLRWRASLENDPAEAELLLSRAEEDLEEAVRIDPARANSWNVLSVIHSQKPDLVDAKIAARRAYEEDAYLRAADQILWRLYATSYDLEQFPDALEYCNEGKRRFPEADRFVECELWLLASRAMEPDPDRAWELVPEMERLVGVQLQEYTRLKGQILVGGVLARAGLVDSAHAVWSRSQGDPEMDPTRDLLALEAVFRLQAGEEQEALDLVKTYLTVNPDHRSGWTWTSHWWWRDLQENQEFRDLLGAGTGG